MNEPDDMRDDELDRRLREGFTPPPSAAFAAIARVATVAPAPRRYWPRVLVAAAALLVVAWIAGSWITARDGRDRRDEGAELAAMWSAAYEHAVANTSHAAGPFCCDPGSDFCRTCTELFTVKLTFGGEGARLHGCYCGLPTGGSVAALAEMPEGPVGIFVVSRANDPRPCLPANSSLRLSRRELGPMVLYGISRSEAPAQRSLERFTLSP